MSNIKQSIRDGLPPHDDDAEAGALACVLSAENGDAGPMLAELSLDSFYDARHRAIFCALSKLHREAKQLDVVALSQAFRDNGGVATAGGLEYLTALPDKTPSTANFPAFLDAIEGFRLRRVAIHDSVEVQRLAFDTSIPAAALADAARRMLESNAANGPGGNNNWAGLVEDGAEAVGEELPPLVEVIEGIICDRSKLVIVSSAKCYKTWLTIYLGLCVSHGIPFLGRSTNRRRILYVNLELKRETFDRRLQASASALGITVDPGWFHHLPLRGCMAGITVGELISRIVGIAKQRQTGLVVLDPVAKCNVEGEENSSRDQTLFFNQIDRLTTEADCTVVLNDHTTKGNQSEKDPLDTIRGSSAKGGDLDAAMVLRKHEVDGCYRVDMVHRELAPVDPFVIGWNYPLMELRPDLDAEDMKKPKGGQTKKYNPEKLCAAIAETTAENPISISAWAVKADITRQTLQGYLPSLRAKGWISTTGEGNTARQFITESGRKAAFSHSGGKHV